MALPQGKFEDGTAHRAREALFEVRKAFTLACDSIDGLSGHRPIDFANTLGIDMKLAWKASRLLRAVGPAEILNELPGRPGHRKLVKAIENAGSSTVLTEDFNRAVEQLYEEMKNLAGSRSLFETMVIGLDGGRDTPLAIEQRRQFFQGVRSVSGMQCDLMYRVDVLAPSATEGYIDCATIRSCVRLVRFHPSAPWRLRVPAIRDDQGQHVGPLSQDPLDQGIFNDKQIPLIRSLCYGDEPNFARVPGNSPSPEFMLSEENIGANSRRTITYGSILRAAEPAGATDSHHGFHQVLRLRTPSELVVFDVLMHRDLLHDAGPAKGVMYSDLYGERFASTYRESDRMPVHVNLETIDNYKNIPVPDKWSTGTFKEMVDLLVSRTGWSFDEFQCQRLSLPYPPVPSSLVYEVELQ